MMKPLSINLDYVDVTNDSNLSKRVVTAHQQIKDKSGLGADFLGWHALPSAMLNSMEIKRILATAQRLRRDSDAILIIGIGGSYLGAKAIIDALSNPFEKSKPEVIFIGHHLSGKDISLLKQYLENKLFSINVISKSGTTTEPAVAFRVFKQLLEDKIGKEEAAKRIVATTDVSKGALRQLADSEGYEAYVIPDDVGGRYSVFTAVGLLPIACAGIEISSLIQGAYEAQQALNVESDDNIVYRYVQTRNQLYQQDKKIEMLVHYEPSMSFVAEWWKQLFGESEGKDHKGLFVASAIFTTDLHSLGQYIQEGERHLFETVVTIAQNDVDIVLSKNKDNADGLNYLSGKKLSEINRSAMLATLLAHQDGGCPSIVLTLKKLDAFHLGYLLYFYQLSCAISGYVLGINPFDQPGVEAYKVNMFSLLEKPGYESETKAIKSRLKL